MVNKLFLKHVRNFNPLFLSYKSEIFTLNGPHVNEVSLWEKALWGQGIVKIKQGILSVPGIAGYELVPARIGLCLKTKYIFHNTNSQLKTGKTGTHSSADTSPVQCSLDKTYTSSSSEKVYFFPVGGSSCVIIHGQSQSIERLSSFCFWLQK